jgi:hypothetical protein
MSLNLATFENVMAEDYFSNDTNIETKVSIDEMKEKLPMNSRWIAT